jgi:tRNA (guanine-N7-)-methyltransferase
VSAEPSTESADSTGSPGASEPAAGPHRRITSFVHHRARMTEGQRAAWDRSWPVLGRDVDAVVGGTEPYDPAAWFGRRAPLVLEIGSGMGETTAALAAATPGVDHLAVEVFEPGLAQLLMRIEELGLTNLRLLRGDAVELLRAGVPPASLDGVRVYFPDPWPKRRHRKRRLVQPEFVALLASRLRPGATLHLATDWADYATQMREVCSAEPLLTNAATAAPDGWTPRPDWRPWTKFEQRAAREGRVVRDLIYRRNSSGLTDDDPR